MARAISPVLGVVLLAACAVLLSATVGAMALAYEPAEPASTVLVIGAVDAGDNEVTLTLDRGGPLDVRRLTLVVEIDGEPLEKQPTVPAYSQSGFTGFPSGPFNAGTDPEWNRGESASLTVAKTTNSPQPDPGSRVEIRIFEDDLPIATVETTAS
ncbi:type IV pilin N-terminal domain-containing protein [Halalkalicoccus sp. NIPERK01]|uniref:type IV pilin N-terminal domain-containing protein n=1 Tax=Halalkalicoccus sp. NIPERK01 TaxID=3053469 RepID=UPI00256EE62C|nr:type IV pilin N-terminal domain-containing protein [Halalkalicoccus sp. NIPERK01]